MSIKLIASDIDGTLLLNHGKEIPGEIFDEVRRLKEKGILFCPASGRQYNSLKNLFAQAALLCSHSDQLFIEKRDVQLFRKTLADLMAAAAVLTGNSNDR